MVGDAGSQAQRQLSGPGLKAAAIVVGTGRSGSTLLAFLLNAHPAIVSTGEVTGPVPGVADASRYPCSCGDSLEVCPFWQRFYRAMQQRGLQFDARHWGTRFALGSPGGPGRLLVRPLAGKTLDSLRDTLVLSVPAWRRALTRIAERNRAFYEVASELTGKPVFVDASKDPHRVRRLQSLTDLRPRVIHLVRDAPAFVASHLKRQKRSLDSAVRSWVSRARQIERLSREVEPERWLRVRYEDLCTDTAAEMERLARFLGQEPSAGPIHFREVEHHIIGNRMRLQSSDQVVLNDASQQVLTPAQFDEVLRRTRRYRQLFGYA